MGEGTAEAALANECVGQMIPGRSDPFGQKTFK